MQIEAAFLWKPPIAAMMIGIITCAGDFAELIESEAGAIPQMQFGGSPWCPLASDPKTEPSVPDEERRKVLEAEKEDQEQTPATGVASKIGSGKGVEIGFSG